MAARKKADDDATALRTKADEEATALRKKADDDAAAARMTLDGDAQAARKKADDDAAAAAARKKADDDVHRFDVDRLQRSVDEAYDAREEAKAAFIEASDVNRIAHRALDGISSDDPRYLERRRAADKAASDLALADEDVTFIDGALWVTEKKLAAAKEVAEAARNDTSNVNLDDVAAAKKAALDRARADFATLKAQRDKALGERKAARTQLDALSATDPKWEEAWDKLKAAHSAEIATRDNTRLADVAAFKAESEYRAAKRAADLAKPEANAPKVAVAANDVAISSEIEAVPASPSTTGKQTNLPTVHEPADGAHDKNNVASSKPDDDRTSKTTGQERHEALTTRAEDVPSPPNPTGAPDEAAASGASTDDAPQTDHQPDDRTDTDSRRAGMNPTTRPSLASETQLASRRDDLGAPEPTGAKDDDSTETPARADRPTPTRDTAKPNTEEASDSNDSSTPTTAPD